MPTKQSAWHAFLYEYVCQAPSCFLGRPTASPAREPPVFHNKIPRKKGDFIALAPAMVYATLVLRGGVVQVRGSGSGPLGRETIPAVGLFFYYGAIYSEGLQTSYENQYRKRRALPNMLGVSFEFNHVQRAINAYGGSQEYVFIFCTTKRNQSSQPICPVPHSAAQSSRFSTTSSRLRLHCVVLIVGHGLLYDIWRQTRDRHGHCAAVETSLATKVETAAPST